MAAEGEGVGLAIPMGKKKPGIFLDARLSLCSVWVPIAIGMNSRQKTHPP
jgi:hypothetical protein